MQIIDLDEIDILSHKLCVGGCM